MDMLAHALRAGVGIAALHHHHPIRRKVAVGTGTLAVLPDVVQALPVAAWLLASGGSWSTWMAFAMALPGHEPTLPSWVTLISHHLHCTLHSVVVAAAITALAVAIQRQFWLPLAGWWLHISIDFFTHSKDYYAVPVLYPFTDWSFDGIAWTTPWFMAANYGALVVVITALALKHLYPKVK